MGCVESTASDEPAMDTNGMFPPPESWRKWAELSLRAGVAIQTTQLFNQMAVFAKATGQMIDALPYPPPEEWRQHAKLTLGANVSIAVTRAFNQQAIFDKIAGEAIESLPYPAPESWRQWAMKNNLHANMNQACKQRFNQGGIFARLMDA